VCSFLKEFETCWDDKPERRQCVNQPGGRLILVALAPWSWIPDQVREDSLKDGDDNLKVREDSLKIREDSLKVRDHCLKVRDDSKETQDD